MQRWGDQIEILGVAWSGRPRDYENFVVRHGLSFPSIDDTVGSLYADLGIPGNPAWGIIRPEGNYEVLMGAATPEVLDMVITRLLES